MNRFDLPPRPDLAPPPQGSAPTASAEQVQQQLLSLLTPQEREELATIMSYFENPSPHESVASVLNNASPRVRQVFAIASEILDTPRFAPFEPKLQPSDIAEHVLGLDPKSAMSVKDSLDGDYVKAQLQKRMGTDADGPPPPLTTRDIIAQAMARHEEE